MKLRAIRPIQKHVSSVPPRLDSPFTLKIAADSLKSSEAVQEDPETQQYRWMIWPSWHALAVALAGLCSIRDTPLAKEAWISVEKAYARQSRHVADTRNGMLWRPIEKLYRKASAFRDHRDDHRDSLTPSVSPRQPQPNQFPPPATAPYPAPPQIDPSAPQPYPQQALRPMMPMTDGLFHGDPPNILYGENAILGGIDLGNNDMSWMDFQRIIEDMSNPMDPTMGDLQWPQHVPRITTGRVRSIRI